MNDFSSQLRKIALMALLTLAVAPLAYAQGLIPNLGTSRAGTAGFQFTKISVDPRAAGLGNSSVADAMDGSSLYWNPALTAQMAGSETMLAHTAYFVGVSNNYMSYVHKFKYSAVGVSLQYLDSGEMNETTEFMKEGTGRTFRTVHYSVGLTYSQQLTELFSYGVTARFLDERLAELTTQSAAVDFGFFYRVGETGLRFAVSLSNFGLDATPQGSLERTTLDGTITEDDFQEVSLPTRFVIGAAYDAWKKDDMTLLLTMQLSNPSDNAERLSFGSEFGYKGMFFGRLGYELGNQEAILPSAGIGFKIPYGNKAINFDYGFTTFERLGSIHRVALRVGL